MVLSGQRDITHVLSYQHIYHAGCLADIHKHMLLAAVLAKMVEKDKPLSYIETHAGRGLYDLKAPEANKTGEYKSGIIKIIEDDSLSQRSALNAVLKKLYSMNGRDFYPGSPYIAATLLRSMDRIHLVEKHPQEFDHLKKNMAPLTSVAVYYDDGYKRALKLAPLQPRRGIVFIDPSYEIKDEYAAMAEYIKKLHKKWPVAVIALWYPILQAGHHKAMLEKIHSLNLPKTVTHEVDFKDRQAESHLMMGSGLFLCNTPYGLDNEFDETREIFS